MTQMSGHNIIFYLIDQNAILYDYKITMAHTNTC